MTFTLFARKVRGELGRGGRYLAGPEGSAEDSAGLTGALEVSSRAGEHDLRVSHSDLRIAHRAVGPNDPRFDVMGAHGVGMPAVWYNRVGVADNGWNATLTVSSWAEFSAAVRSLLA